MGSTCSVNRTSSPLHDAAEDAYQVSPDTMDSYQFSNSSGRDNSFCSAESSLALNENVKNREKFSNSVYSREFEKSSQLNFLNLQASFLSSILPAINQLLYDGGNTHEFSLSCEEYVVMCASFILSTLELYGQRAPRDTLMFHMLNNLLEFLSNMKLNHEHLDNRPQKEVACSNCEIRQLLLRHVTLKNIHKNASFCDICLKIVPTEELATHTVTVSHKYIKEKLLEEIFPFACHKCRLKFSKKGDLDFHLCQHDVHATHINGNEFNPLCCYLCRVPVDNEEELKRHFSTSTEHGLKKEIAVELIMRRYIDSEEYSSPDFNVTGKVDTSPELVLENQKYVNAAAQPTQQYHSSTSTNTDVINDTAMYLRSKIRQEGEKVNPSKPTDSEHSSNISVCNFVESQYYCRICQVKVPKANKEDHEMGVKHRKLLRALEKKQKIVSPECSHEKRQISDKKFNSLSESFPILTAHELVKTLLAFEESFVKQIKGDSNGNYECSMCQVKCTDCSMVLHVLENEDHLNLWSKVQTLQSMKEKLEVYKYLKTYNMYKKALNKAILKLENFIEQKNEETRKVNLQILEDNKNKANFGETTVSGAQEYTSTNPNMVLQELLILEKNFVWLDTERGAKMYVCSLCLVSCEDFLMAYHILGKKHCRKWCESHTLIDQERKLETLKHFQKQVLLTSSAYKDFVEKSISTVETCIRLRKEKVTVEEKLPESVSQEPIMRSQSSEVRCEDVNSSKNAIVIGASDSCSLQAEFLKACGDRDTEDFEVECGTCGSLFSIYNGDIDFSLDMHIQNDPQHSLATAVPVERNAQNMSEISKTKTISPKTHSNKFSVCHKLVQKVTGLKEVFEVISQLEKTHLSIKNKGYYCKLCSIPLNNECSVVHHCLMPAHMTVKWASNHTTEKLQEKFDKIHSLLNFMYSGSSIKGALKRIALFISERNQPSNKLIKYKSNPIVSNEKAKSSSVNHHTLNSVSVKSRIVVPSTEVKGFCECCHSSVTSKKHQVLCIKDPADLYFCDTCKILMGINDKIHHLKGKKHVTNILENKS